MKVVKHSVDGTKPFVYVFTLSDGNEKRYELKVSELVGKMSDNSEEQYKAIQAYARENLGGLSVQLSIFS